MTITELENDELYSIKEKVPLHTFNVPAYLFFENQVPFVGGILLEGKIDLTRKNRVIMQLKEGDLFGIYELMNNIPFKAGAYINEGSKVCIIDKSSVLEFLHGHHGQAVQNLFRTTVTLKQKNKKLYH